MQMLDLNEAMDLLALTVCVEERECSCFGNGIRVSPFSGHSGLLNWQNI